MLALLLTVAGATANPSPFVKRSAATFNVTHVGATGSTGLALYFPFDGLFYGGMALEGAGYDKLTRFRLAYFGLGLKREIALLSGVSANTSLGVYLEPAYVVSRVEPGDYTSGWYSGHAHRVLAMSFVLLGDFTIQLGYGREVESVPRAISAYRGPLPPYIWLVGLGLNTG